jgi:hypothetical protein
MANDSGILGQMKIDMLNPADLKPYGRNPRKNDGAVKAVAESIRRYGFRQPIVVDCDMVIIVGHTRWKAAKLLGLSEVPAHIADMPKDQAREYRIADNKTNELAEWDLPVLNLEMKGLDLDWIGRQEKPDDWEESSPNSQKAPKATLSIPAKVWLTQREQIVKSVEDAIAGYGAGVEWPS